MRQAQDQKFWDAIRNLTRSDASIAVPKATVSRAVAIFQPPARPSATHFLRAITQSLQPVRRVSPVQKFLFQGADGMMVQLQLSRDESGYVLTGWVHGFEDAPAQLYGNEFVAESNLADGQFQFENLPAGKYRLALSHRGVDYWITGLDLLTKGGTPGPT